jgi:hypothetical protein
MSQAVDYRAAHRERVEQAALEHLIQRLTDQFPEVARETIVKAVRGEYEEYEDSKVRDFVPILVERTVRADLRQFGPHRFRA